MRIALIGTFDVENFGDLLFPVIVNRWLHEVDVDLFSPHGDIIMPFSEKIYVWPIQKLEERIRLVGYQAIVIGGGDLIRLDTPAQSIYEEGGDIIFRMWALPLMLGNKYSIPVLFNAPGVPFRFEKRIQPLIKELFKAATYISVRDENSATYLRECGIENIQVVPDTVLSISEIYPKDQLKMVREDLRKRVAFGEDGSYVILQHNCCNIDDELYVEQLKKIKQVILDRGDQILFMPIGYVHKDEIFMEMLFDYDNEKEVFVREKLSPVEICALLAGSKAYIGSSMHGAVVSYAYGRPEYVINTSNYSKITGLLRELGHTDREIRFITNALSQIRFDDKVNNTEHKQEIMRRIRAHFEKLREMIDCSIETSDDAQPDLLRLCYSALNTNSCEPEEIRNARVYYDFGCGFYEDTAFEMPYNYDQQTKMSELELFLPKGVKQIRIDPVENKLIRVKRISAMADGSPCEIKMKNTLQDKEDVIILNYDPQIIITDINEISKISVKMILEVLRDEDVLNLVGGLNWGLLLQKESSKSLSDEKILLLMQNEGLTKAIAQKETMIEELTQELAFANDKMQEIEGRLNAIENSLFWNITKPARVLSDKFIRTFKKQKD